MPKIDATTTKQAKSNVAVLNNTGTPPTSSTMLGYGTHDNDDGHLTHVVDDDDSHTPHIDDDAGSHHPQRR